MFRNVIPQITIRTFLPVFLGMPVLAFLIIVYILFNPSLWGLFFLYGLWYMYDRKRPWHGGRSSKFMRSMKIWEYCGQYFDMEMVKTVDIPPDHNYIFSCHPHGVLGIGTILNFATEATGIARNFPKLAFRLVTLPINFYVPLHRDIFGQLGLIASDADSISNALNMADKGIAVTIVPGGAEESMDSHSYNYDLTLKERKGFVKLAIKNGASLVPVYNFGENKTYHTLPNERGSFVRRVQQIIKKATGISPIMVCGVGFFNTYFGIIPKQVKIASVVGAPIHTKRNPNPTQQEIDHLHAEYVEALVALFETHKHKYRIKADVHLRIL